MKLHKKLSHWASDYVQMARGTTQSLIHHTPPKHYLAHTTEGAVPVILIPGILGKWGFMKNLGDKISLAGHPVYIIPDLKFNLNSIPASAKFLGNIISGVWTKESESLEELHHAATLVAKKIAAENLKGVVIVAHSKGGLIGKYFLTYFNSDNEVLGMVTIATPFSGSAMAKMVPHDAFRELKEDSEIIKDLINHSEINNKIISIIPEYDNHVWSEKGSFLEGALQNIIVPIHGHHKILFDKNVHTTVLEAVSQFTRSAK